MAEPATNWQGRKHVNVVDPDLQARVGKLVDEVMRPVVQAVFHARDAAAKACARVMQPITNKYNLEVGALLFSLVGDGNGPTRVGAPVAGRENCQLSYQCGVIVRDGGVVPTGLLSGYFHTHPVERAFSDNDLFVASKMHNWRSATQDVVAYVSLPSGRVFAWSTRTMQDDPQRTWRDYAKHTVRELR